MGTDKRERKKANRAAKIEAERAAERRARRIRTARNAVIAAVLLVVAMLLISILSGCSSSEGSDALPCKTSDNGDTQVLEFDEEPKRRIDPEKTYTATFTTNKGTVVAELDTDRTPNTANNFVALAENCYFDDTELFRTEALSGIIQGGSPHTQDGTDEGPGYQVDDEGGTFSEDDYGPGTLAMARTAAPDSASAQFFFLSGENGRYLGEPGSTSSGTYVKFGQVTEGIDVLERIAALDDGSGAPSEKVVVKTVRIDES